MRYSSLDLLTTRYQERKFEDTYFIVVVFRSVEAFSRYYKAFTNVLQMWYFPCILAFVLQLNYESAVYEKFEYHCYTVVLQKSVQFVSIQCNISRCPCKIYYLARNNAGE